MKGQEQILVYAAIVVFIIVKRFAGSPVGSKTLVLPAIMTGYGLIIVFGNAHHVNAVSVGLIAVEVVVSIAAGFARAATIKLYMNDGHLWQRYTFVTLSVWILMVAVRIGFMALGDHLGASLNEGGMVLFAFGLSMLLETYLVTRRAQRTGAPILPRDARRRTQVRH